MNTHTHQYNVMYVFVYIIYTYDRNTGKNLLFHCIASTETHKKSDKIFLNCQLQCFYICTYVLFVFMNGLNESYANIQISQSGISAGCNNKH